MSYKSIESTEDSFLSLIILLIIIASWPVTLPVFCLIALNKNLLLILKKLDAEQKLVIK